MIILSCGEGGTTRCRDVFSELQSALYIGVAGGQVFAKVVQAL